MRNIEKNEKMFNVTLKTRTCDEELTTFRQRPANELGEWIRESALAPGNQDDDENFGLWLEVNLYGSSSNNATARSFARKEAHSDEYTLKLRPVDREACVELTEGGRVRLRDWEFTDRSGKRQIMDLTLHPKDGSAHVKSVRRCHTTPRKEGKRRIDSRDTSRARERVAS